MDVNLLQLVGSVDAAPISREEWKEQQVMDEVVGPVYRCVEEKRRPSEIQGYDAPISELVFGRSMVCWFVK